MKNILVTKEDGEKEAFNPQKVTRALKRSGLSGKECEAATKLLSKQLYDGITTREIYRKLYRILDEMRPEISHKFNLKRALLDMGPAGYAFEDFTGRLFSLEGYDTKIRQVLQGKYVTHEIDVVASKAGKTYMVECKFYNKGGYKCRIQTALYVYARYLDLVGRTKKMFTKPWLVTNTKFSEDVLAYAEGMKIPLLGWRYPLKDGLESKIDRLKCYPITVADQERNNNDI